MNDEKTSEDKLTLYYYGELDLAQKSELEEILRHDAACARRYQRLCDELESLSVTEEEQAPPQAVARWHAALDTAISREQRTTTQKKPWFDISSFVWGTAVTATLVVGFSIGVWYSDTTAVNTLSETGTAHDVPENSTTVPISFARGLHAHLKQSHADIRDNTIDDQTSVLLLEIVRQNRLFERAADANNSPQLARVLRSFEPILLQLASDELTQGDADALRSQLAFELNVMLTKLQRDTSEQSHST